MRFPGQYYDSESGLHYNWYRYYSPNSGNYIKEDPIFNEEIFGMRFIKSMLFKPINFNNYIYSIQNPLRYSDSAGLACGPGWLGDVLWDDYKFESCCQEHDNCYSGSGEHRCKKRKRCDEEFCACMTAKCEEVWDKANCRQKAYNWCNIVKRRGGSRWSPRSCPKDSKKVEGKELKSSEPDCKKQECNEVEPAIEK